MVLGRFERQCLSIPPLREHRLPRRTEAIVLDNQLEKLEELKERESKIGLCGPRYHRRRVAADALLQSSALTSEVIPLGDSKLALSRFRKGMRIVIVVPSPISLRTSS